MQRVEQILILLNGDERELILWKRCWEQCETALCNLNFSWASHRELPLLDHRALLQGSLCEKWMDCHPVPDISSAPQGNWPSINQHDLEEAFSSLRLKTAFPQSTRAVFVHSSVLPMFLSQKDRGDKVGREGRIYLNSWKPKFPWSRSSGLPPITCSTLIFLAE